MNDRVRIVGWLLLLVLGCDGRAPDPLAEVRSLQEAGRFEESLTAVRDFLEKRPQDPEGNLLLGAALLATGQPTLAAWPLTRATESPEWAAKAGILLGSALLLTANPEEAVQAADRVLQIAPDDPAALELRARGAVMSLRFDAALADADRVLTIDPDNVGALAVRAIALTKVDRPDEAERALELLEERSDVEPSSDVAARACAARASFLQERRDLEAAERVLRDCLGRYPTEPLVVRYAVEFFDEVEKPDAATRVLREALEATPEALGVRLSLAQRLRAAGEMTEAEALVVEGTRLSPTPQAWASLADFHRTGGDLPAARSALEKALELDGERSEPLLFAYAGLLADLGEIDQAEAVAAKLQASVYADLIRGWLALARGDARSALAALDAGIRLWPNNAGARYVAARAAEALGDHERALSEYREAVRSDAAATDAELDMARLHAALGNHQAALEFAARYVRSHGRSPWGYVMAARSWLALGSPANARAALAPLQRLEGEEVTAAVELASVERAARGPAHAAAVVEESGLDLSDPKNEPALRSLVDDLLAEGQSPKALGRAEAALRAHPDAASLHDLHGRALRLAGDPAAARAAFERAIELAPELASAHAGLAGLAWEAGDTTRAIELFDRASELEPTDASLDHAAAQLVLGLGDRAGAEVRLRRLVEAHPQHAGSCNDLAWLLAEGGEDLDRALELAERATRFGPGPESWDTLGWVRLRRGEYAEARDALARGVEAGPSIPGIRYRLGLALAAQGDREEALESLREALRTGPFPEAEAAKGEIARLEDGPSDDPQATPSPN